jgi:dolichol-phosphate mannosyltransferase
MKKAMVVLPTYNEAKNVPIIIPLIFEQAKKIKTHELHVLVVDDNSPDGTQDRVRKCMQDFANLHLITGEKKGLGEAYKRGIDYAVKILGADLIFQMDADLQHDPALIPLFIALSNHGFSLVIGSRFAPGGSTPNFSLRRRLLSLVANWMIRFLGGLPRIHDCTSGYRCIKADLIKKCSFSVLATRGYSFQSSLLFELLRQRARVIEVPITFPDRLHGESKLTFQDQLEFLMNIGKIRFQKSHEFIKFCVVGTTGVFVNMGLYIVLTRTAGIPMEYASPIAIELSILSNFALNDLWTFRNRTTNTALWKRLYRFHLVSLCAGLANYSVLLSLAKIFNVWDILANLIGISIGTLINYSMNSLWTWRETRKSTTLEPSKIINRSKKEREQHRSKTERVLPNS